MSNPHAKSIAAFPPKQVYNLGPTQAPRAVDFWE
jgi:hypothetical protein